MTQPRRRLVRPGKLVQRSVPALYDNVFFVFGGVASVWLAWLVLTESVQLGLWTIAVFIVFWLVLAYLALPRLTRILTSIYVPDYFIGRARTSDGLLGDPINAAVLGSSEQLTAAMTAAGWIRADPITLATSWRIVTSTILRRSYDQAPVSPLLLFGRQQDVAWQQEMLGNPAKRHHVRFWQCPDDWLLPGGHRADWLAAGTFDRSVGFSLFTLQITHKIDANIDIERDYIVASMLNADVGAEVQLIRNFSTGYHSRNGGGDLIETDGHLPVIDLRDVRPEPSAAAAPIGPEAAVGVRPIQTSIGAALVAARTLAGILFLMATFGGIQQLIHDAVARGDISLVEGSEDQAHLAVWLVGIALAIPVLFYLFLAVLAFRGSNWARIAAMVVSSLLVLFTAADYFSGLSPITVRTNLPGLALDILVLLALSSTKAREWARAARG